ncbi:hypothetical protein [Cognatitamlana onchidii]|uniref:hypothetical protein n=1 Tax=Cognatitamlana onchidii TaxID=2562860 RepID=UPI0010A5DF1E|nr:hypothetical protein [Algibacter onchidii]
MKTSEKQSPTKSQVEQEIKLVDGMFNPSDAANIIDAILDIKINYHKLKRLSITEGNCNDPCEYDSGRINELIDAKLDAKSFFKDARKDMKKLKLYGTLSIKIEE